MTEKEQEKGCLNDDEIKELFDWIYDAKAKPDGERINYLAWKFGKARMEKGSDKR